MWQNQWKTIRRDGAPWQKYFHRIVSKIWPSFQSNIGDACGDDNVDRHGKWRRYERYFFVRKGGSRNLYGRERGCCFVHGLWTYADIVLCYPSPKVFCKQNNTIGENWQKDTVPGIKVLLLVMITVIILMEVVGVASEINDGGGWYCYSRYRVREPSHGANIRTELVVRTSSKFTCWCTCLMRALSNTTIISMVSVLITTMIINMILNWQCIYNHNSFADDNDDLYHCVFWWWWYQDNKEDDDDALSGERKSKMPMVVVITNGDSPWSTRSHGNWPK